MKLKIFILSFTCIMIAFLAITVLEDNTTYDTGFLDEKNSVNLFDSTTYLIESYNALVSQNELSTGMYTDSNRNNFYVIFKLEPDNPLLNELLEQGQASIVFESHLQKTTEWINDNKYKISMYYESKEDKENLIEFFSQTWIGTNHTVSGIQIIPKEAIGSAIYIKYESILNSFLFLTNGNDLRFCNNYLAIKGTK